MIDKPIGSLKGVGAVKQAALARLGITGTADLIRHYPRDYEDRRGETPIASLTPDTTATVRATVVSAERGGFRAGARGGRAPVRLTVRDGTGALQIVFFSAPYLAKLFSRGDEYRFFGKVVESGGFLRMNHPDFSRADDAAARYEIWPVYPLTAGISQRDMRRWSEELLPVMREAAEYLPPETLRRNKVCDIAYALENIHRPADGRRLREAKYRLVFEELLTLQMGLLMLKRTHEKADGIAFSAAVDVGAFTRALPYELTGAQKRALAEILSDMESPRAMNRLLQGDVGSGKTVIAAAAAFKAMKCGCQAVMMAPTELLAQQHREEFRALLEPHGARVGFLTGSLKAAERRAALEAAARGETDVLVGTHAVISPDVAFANLGLVVTDEQHRFGVNQRVSLSKKGVNPDILVMTATPIPRSLALILYGDLDVSIMDERPPGRRRVVTRATDASGRAAAYAFMHREVAAGRQAYVVAPLVEDSEESDLRSAVSLHEELTVFFEGFATGLVHGRMKPAEKEVVMARFHAGEIRVLISTVLIEVGIHVPAATVMLIENAERFGLAQLHQLRGRVGRGEHRSYCILITEGETTEAKERARTMVASDDGFFIAEKDMELRGPGEFFGVRQHGLPPLSVADPIKHVKALHAVRAEAALILSQDPDLSEPENRGLRERIAGFFRSAGEIGI